MTSDLMPTSPLVRDLLWQTTLWLLLGAAASLWWARWPARAHRLLLLTLVAALVTPLASQTVRLWGWGLFVRTLPAAADQAPEATTLLALAEPAAVRQKYLELVVSPALTNWMAGRL